MIHENLTARCLTVFAILYINVIVVIQVRKRHRETAVLFSLDKKNRKGRKKQKEEQKTIDLPKRVVRDLGYRRCLSFNRNR